MASYVVANNEVGAHAKTLVAATVDTVTFTDRDAEVVEVVNISGADAIYFTTDGAAPIVAGNGTYFLPALTSTREVGIPTAGTTVIKLISAGTPSYSVSWAR